MTDQLHEVLTRVADRAGPVSVDPLLWAKASRTRRRRQKLTAAAAVLVVVALLGGIVLAAGARRPAPPPVDRPVRHDSIKIEGIAGDGGLRVEKNLAIGPASVAIANDTGAFVVTADGVTHRLALPGFDAKLYATTAAKQGVEFPETLSLSPDGTKLIYAWHAPFPPRRADAPKNRSEGWGDGWIDSGARLLDLTTGALDTYPYPSPGPEIGGLITRLGRFNWNFRWSPDSRLVAFDETISAGVGWGGWEGQDGSVLDTTKNVTRTRRGPQHNPRPVPEMRGPSEISAPAVNDAGLVAWVNTPDRRGRPQYEDQSFMIGTTNRAPASQPLADDVIWGSGQFSSDGQTLLVESAAPSDRLLAVDTGQSGSARQLRLEGGLPSKQVRTRLLGWVGADQVLAAVHQATGARSWEVDADLALLTLNFDAGTADLTLAGRVDAGDTGSAFSFATDVLAADIPPNESNEPTVDETDSARNSETSPTLGSTGLPHPWLVLSAVGLALGAAVAMMVRRKRA